MGWMMCNGGCSWESGLLVKSSLEWEGAEKKTKKSVSMYSSV